MAEKNKVPSAYKQGTEIKSWLDKTGPIFLKDMKQYLKPADYNKIYKAYHDADGATSTERLKKFKEFESLLNTVIFDKAEKGMARYNEFVKQNPDKKGVFSTENDRQMFEAFDTALKFKKSMPTKEHNYERISLDNYVENNGQGYTPEDMKYLAGLYDLDYENAEDRSELNKAIAKVTRQKQIEEIMDESTLVNFVLPVAKEYAKRNIDNLQGDFSDKIADIPGTLRNNPGLAAAVVADAGTNAAMFGAGGTAGKQGLAKAGTYAYNYAAAPAIREAGHVALGNKDIGQGALDFVVGGVGTNVATPKMLNALTVKPAAGAWRWAEGKGAASKTMQQKVDEAARKAAKTENDMKQKGQIAAVKIPGHRSYLEDVPKVNKNTTYTLSPEEVQELKRNIARVKAEMKNKPKPDKVKVEVDRDTDRTIFTYIAKDGHTYSLSPEEVLKLKRGEKLTGNASHVSLEDIISSKEYDEYALNSPLIRRHFSGKGQKADVKKLYAYRSDQFDLTPERRQFLENSEGFAEYTPYEYAISTGSIESTPAFLDRKVEELTNASLDGIKGISKGGIAEAFGTAAKNYGINALGKPEYGGRITTGAVNAAAGLIPQFQNLKYTYGGEEQDAMQGSSQNDLALYLLQYKKFLENPEYYSEPEDPEGYSKKSVEKLKQSVKDVYGSKNK